MDTYGSVSTVARSDVNLIVTVNPKTKQILMTSILRDCEIQLHKNGKWIN
ncbi:MAG: LCP family protein [Streptococcus sp.]